MINEIYSSTSWKTVWASSMRGQLLLYKKGAFSTITHGQQCIDFILQLCEPRGCQPTHTHTQSHTRAHTHARSHTQSRIRILFRLLCMLFMMCLLMESCSRQRYSGHECCKYPILPLSIWIRFFYWLKSSIQLHTRILK